VQYILEQIETEIQPLFGLGKVADYIPELAKINSRQFAMSVRTLDGDEYSVGDFNQEFSIQSISKVFVLAMAMEILGDELWDRVGREPSGTSFNSLIQLETEEGKPRNPFINAGALVTTDAIIKSCLNQSTDAYKEILNFVRTLSNNPKIDYDKRVASSEMANAERNTALTYFMKSFKNVNSEPMELLDVYSHHCSLSMTTLDLARAFQFLANRGLNPFTGDQMISDLQARRVNSLMMTCGLYDNVGDFAYRVGLPAKSGVGGGIVAVVPNKLTVCVWSPELNPSGNSLIGTRALELFTQQTNYSVF
jgi:glutaminase